MIIQRLDKSHDRQKFDCGHDEINRYLKTLANQHAKKNIAKTHVLIRQDSPNVIMGFYTLSAIDIELKLKGYPNQLPAMLIGRIGVDKAYQGQGLSKILLSHALKKIKQISQDAGIAMVVIDAKDEHLANYYQRLGFVATDTPKRLVMETRRLE